MKLTKGPEEISTATSWKHKTYKHRLSGYDPKRYSNKLEQRTLMKYQKLLFK